MSTPTTLPEDGISNLDQEFIDSFFRQLEETKSHDSSKHKSSLEASQPSKYLTSSNITHFSLGTGHQILSNIVPSILSAHSSVIIVTCFWAQSSSQQSLSTALLHLSQRAQSENRLVNVKLCFSSSSLWQKFTHTASLSGQTYPPKVWKSKFGLPSEDELLRRPTHPTHPGDAGVALTVKSAFVRPFSVMHPKFVVVDRRRVFLPSCNVSWEDWFEGCISLSGPITSHFLDFYHDFWEQRRDIPPLSASSANHNSPLDSPSIEEPTELIADVPLNFKSLPTLFLPSPHHPNPSFRPFPCQSPPHPPPTPLNTFLLTCFTRATTSLYIRTPNLTSAAVLSGILFALARGVDVTIRTSPRMMVLEQLLTAGRVTEVCVRRLIRQYKAMVRQHENRVKAGDGEEGVGKVGKLGVRYYRPRTGDRGEEEPVKSHLKLTVVDERIVVLGSGNMDRASWYTNQELGAAFFSQGLAKRVMKEVEKGLEGRVGEEQVRVERVTVV